VDAVLDWSLLAGAVPTVVTTAGVIAFLALLVGRGRVWWVGRVPRAVCIALLVTAVLTVAVDDWWQPFPDALPQVAIICLAFAATAILLATMWPRQTGPARPIRRGVHRFAAAMAACVVVLAAAVQVNVYFGQYPTLRSALGARPQNEVTFGQVGQRETLAPRPAADRPLAADWRRPQGLPARGRLSEVAIPGTTSGFHPRTGWVYLPPAYFARPRPVLPVLVLVAGQPGTPRDWLDGGRLDEVLDRYADAHAGLAPVIVVVDDLGRTLANPLCLDSRLGRVETYLTVDAPAWIRGHLQVDPRPQAWAIGGFSQGGTCALQMAVRAPQVYPTFLDISGQAEPTLGSRERTVSETFGGDVAAFRRVNPLDQLATTRYPATHGVIISGKDDADYGPQQRRVFDACRAAGMQVSWMELPGGHTWAVWGPALEKSLPWLGTRLGLTT
jgi:S-formylglutathione hydrolase FrmB